MTTLSNKEAGKLLAQFVPYDQATVIAELANGEEGMFFKAKMWEFLDIVQKMPATYGQDGVKDPIVYLKYFYGSATWYITEKDSEAEQLQAFGFADLGYGAEMGYISLAEILESGAELDLYFTPKPWSEVNGSNAMIDCAA